MVFAVALAPVEVGVAMGVLLRQLPPLITAGILIAMAPEVPVLVTPVALMMFTPPLTLITQATQYLTLIVALSLA
jgi:hypothetical protein